MSKEVEGVYSVGDVGEVSVIDAPQWSIDALHAVDRELRAARRIATDRQLTTQAAQDKVIRYIDENIRPANPAVADVLSQKISAAPRRKWPRIIDRMLRVLALAVILTGGTNDLVAFPETVETGIEFVMELYERVANGTPKADSSRSSADPSDPPPSAGER